MQPGLPETLHVDEAGLKLTEEFPASASLKICLLKPGLFCSPWCSPVPSIFPWVAQFCCPLWLNILILCVYISSVSIRLLLSVPADLITQLLWTAPQCIWVYKYFFHGRFHSLRYISRSDTAPILNYSSSSGSLIEPLKIYVTQLSSMWYLSRLSEGNSNFCHFFSRLFPLQFIHSRVSWHSSTK